MIRVSPSFITSDDKSFVEFELAQEHELEILIESGGTKNLAAYLVKNSDKVIDILTTKKGSRPGARSINGGKKPRKSKKPKDPVVAPPSPFAPEEGVSTPPASIA